MIEEIPEIRVWCHPAKLGKGEADYYHVFPTFTEAISYIRTNKEAEDAPLIAFKGYEINIFDVPSLKQE